MLAMSLRGLQSRSRCRSGVCKVKSLTVPREEEQDAEVPRAQLARQRALRRGRAAARARARVPGRWRAAPLIMAQRSGSRW